MSDQPRRDDVGSSPRATANPYTRARPFVPELLDYICETLPHQRLSYGPLMANPRPRIVL